MSLLRAYITSQECKTLGIAASALRDVGPSPHLTAKHRSACHGGGCKVTRHPRLRFATSTSRTDLPPSGDMHCSVSLTNSGAIWDFPRNEHFSLAIAENPLARSSLRKDCSSDSAVCLIISGSVASEGLIFCSICRPSSTKSTAA